MSEPETPAEITDEIEPRDTLTFALAIFSMLVLLLLVILLVWAYRHPPAGL